MYSKIVFESFFLRLATEFTGYVWTHAIFEKKKLPTQKFPGTCRRRLRCVPRHGLQVTVNSELMSTARNQGNSNRFRKQTSQEPKQLSASALLVWAQIMLGFSDSSSILRRCFPGRFFVSPNSGACVYAYYCLCWSNVIQRPLHGIADSSVKGPSKNSSRVDRAVLSSLAVFFRLRGLCSQE